MSLTGHLVDGDLGRWCAANLTGTPRLAAEVAAAPATTPPVRPARIDDPRHWATIGGALGQRLAFAVQHAPPYYALLGAHRAGLADRATVHACAARFPTHTGLTANERARAIQLRPLPAGHWLDLDPPGPPPAAGAPPAPHGRPGLVTEFIDRLAAFLAAHAAPGQLADSRGAEAVLARACVVLTDWETAYRAGALPPATAALYDDPTTTVADLLAAVPDHQVAELVDLAALAHRRGVLHRLAPASGASGIAGPVFVEHWADGDLLIPTTPSDAAADPAGGTVLLDVKTVTSARDPTRVARWLWQLLGYAWLDTGDRYRIRTVGLYLARHGTLITWPLDRFTTALLDGRDTAAAARGFRRLAEHALATDTRAALSY